MRYIYTLAIALSSILMVTCSDTRSKSLGVRTIETKVEKVIDDPAEVFKMGGNLDFDKYILTMLTPSHGKIYKVNRLRNLRTGDCIKIRVETFTDGTVYNKDSFVYNCDHPNERMIKGKVVNSWKRGETRFVKVEVADDFGMNDMDFWDMHFKDFNPQDGDCVKVWIYDIHHPQGENFSIINRNLAPCEN